MWNVAIDRGHVAVNPCYRMSKVAPERARRTVLSDDELRELWAALDAQPGNAADAIRLRLLTGQRGGEVHSMAWPDVDVQAGMWEIPPEDSKSGRPHRVPLSKPARATLQRRLDARETGELRVFPRFYHQRKDLRAMGAIHNGAYRWHDLRRSVASRLAALGVPEGKISRVLGHAQRGVTATVYNQYQYDDEKRRALNKWARELMALVSDKPGADVVVPFPGR